MRNHHPEMEMKKETDVTVIAAYVPVKTISEANRSRHEHWGSIYRRTRKQKEAVRLVLASRIPAQTKSAPVTVTLTRVAPRRLDEGDNLAASLKAVRDAVAACLGRDDGDPSITWRYAQERGKPKEYAVKIQLSFE